MQTARRRKDSENTGQYLSKLFFKYIPYWPIFLIVTAICLGYSWYKLEHQNPLYSATIKILVEDKTQNSKVMEELSASSPKSDVENQIEVIKSLPLMVNVVKSLNLYAPVYEKGNFIPHTAYQISPIVIKVANPDSIMEQQKIPFSYNEKSKQVVIRNSSYPLNSFVKTEYGELKFEQNPNYNGDDFSENSLYFSLLRPSTVASSINNNLGVGNPQSNSSILYISLVDESPKRAENILNELMAVYDKASMDEKNKVAAKTLSFVENRLNVVSKGLDSIERAREQFRSSKNTYNSPEMGGVYLQNIASSEKEVENINLQLSVLKQLENFVLSPQTSGGIPSTYGINDQVLGQLVERLYNAQTQYSKSLQTRGENDPMMTSLSMEISKLKPSILEHIQSHRNNLITSRSHLQGSANVNTGMLSSLPRNEERLIDINREQSIKNNIYTFLLQKREEANLSFASTVPDSRVLTSAVANWVPISPNAKRTYLISILIAFAVSIGLITAKELFSRNILYRSEIESLTSLPVVGEIAYANNVRNFISDSTESSILPDQFRKLRTSLTFLGVNSKRKRILITSTIPGEGKSFIAANLGLSLATAGKKVVLLEFDLAQPALSTKLNAVSDEGLVDYILGEKEPEEIIKRTETHENLFIISSGPLPPNPSELILHNRVPELLNYLDGLFDIIIIDTAPVGPMTDAYILSSYCDATLYVVRHGYTPKMLLDRIDEENKINPIKNAAIVFNAVKTRGFLKSPYGYGYDYTYKYLPNSKTESKRKRLTHKNNIG